MTSSFSTQFEASLARFESAWQSTGFPQLRKFLPIGCSIQELIEFILVDMEFRWSLRAGTSCNDHIGLQPSWQNYFSNFPELGAVHALPHHAMLEFLRIVRYSGRKLEPGWINTLFPETKFELSSEIELLEREVCVESPALSFADVCGNLSYRDYLLEQLIGSGGFGKVYRARDLRTNRHVAVKALRKDRQSDYDSVVCFIEEASLVSGFDHPGIVRIHGLGRFPAGGFFLVMDWIEGETLQAKIERSPLSSTEATSTIRRTASAVAYAHAHGVYHCDLKPANILLDRDGNVFVTDFGLARLADAQENLISGGTPAYLAPEQWDRDWGTVGPSTDLFGLGGLLLAMLTGLPPHSELSRESNRDEWILQPLARLNSLLDSSPFHFVCERCLAPDPSARFRSIDQFLQQLDSIEF